MSPVSSTAGSFVRSGKVRDLYAIGEDRLAGTSTMVRW